MRHLLASWVTVLFITASFAAADRAGVEWTLDRMRTAVLAGDPEAYLACVLTEDPIFLKEQQNWAADLKRHVPTEFRLSIHEPEPEPPAEPPSPPTEPASDGTSGATDTETSKTTDGTAAAPIFDDEIGLARFEMVMDWTMPALGRDGKDITRSISFPVTFRRTDDGQWRYGGEDWQVVESHAASADKPDDNPDDDEPELPVSTAPNRARYFTGFEDVAKLVVTVLPQVRAHVDDGFENPVTHVQEVKIYPSMRHLQASIYLSYVDGLSGWNEPGEAIKLISSNKSRRGHLRTLLAHEYGHVATFELGPEATNMPWWVLEGVAELSAEKFVAINQGKADDLAEYGRGARTTVERWARRGRLADWDKISDFRNTDRSLMGHVYQQGHHMVGYISHRFGRATRNAWLRAMAQGQSIDEASREVLSMSFDDLNRDWRDSLPAEEPEEPKPESPEASEPAK